MLKQLVHLILSQPLGVVISSPVCPEQTGGFVKFLNSGPTGAGHLVCKSHSLRTEWPGLVCLCLQPR